ncbi:MAG TPA: hypothetical protein O0X27_04840 [Methanocorpusculum sp.]|nr:hypothetical protein [Methanocorpusculum sp.]
MSRTDAPVSFTMPAELKEEFVKLAKRNQRSVTQELNIAVREHIMRENDPGSMGLSHSELAEIIKETILDMKEKKII